jgi:hypothetical protein
MRTHLLHIVPSTEPDADTSCAANDERYGSTGPIALIAATAVATAAKGRPTTPAANTEDERYWLDGYAGI